MRLLTMSYSEVVELIEEFEVSVKKLKEDLFKIAWYMRGSVSLNEIYNTTNKDRTIMYDMISDHLKTTKESGLPFF